jgi:uncharacterized protein YjbI with pentapeptide repeats
MLHRPLTARVLAAAAILAGLLTMTASATAQAASCPQVDTSTGAVTPAPSAGVDWSGCDLAGANLGEAVLTGANLAGANLTVANATGAQLMSANLTGATLTNTDLDNANVSGANLSSTDLTTAQLTGLQSGGISGGPVLPYGWVIYNGYLAGPYADLAGADLAGLTETQGVLGGANLSNANLTGASLPSGDLVGTNLTSAELTGADLADSDLALTNLTGADLTSVDLNGASLDATIFTGAIWSNTTCPNGTNSNSYDNGCESALNVTPPVAHSSFQGTEVNGWFSAPATLDWNWSDAGPLNPAYCPSSSTTTGNGLDTLTASCTDLAGNSASDSVPVYVDATRPAVTLQGVNDGDHYALGSVPAAVCVTREMVSGVSQAAVPGFSGGRHGVGAITVTCSGAVSIAGLAQPAPVRAGFTVGYGFGGFSTPAPGALITPARTLTVRFGLRAGKSAAIPAATARALARTHEVRVIFTGPGIAPVTAACAWNNSDRRFTCTLRVPAKVRTGRRNQYRITAQEDVGTGFFTAPAGRKAADPETISFR